MPFSLHGTSMLASALVAFCTEMFLYLVLGTTFSPNLLQVPGKAKVICKNDTSYFTVLTILDRFTITVFTRSPEDTRIDRD